MKITIHTDVHIGAPNAINERFLHFEKMENNYLIGDIVDLRNCKKKEVQKYLLMYQNLKDVYGDCYLAGNHEAVTTENQIKVVENTMTKKRTLLAHGDIESDPIRWTKYRQEEHGANAFKRILWVNSLEFLEQIFNRKPKVDFLDRAAGLAKKHNCTQYICGHFHPKEKIEVMHMGIKIIILPRGKNEIEI